ncbi:MAG: glycosyltransferase family 2 protein, partial [Armatimonadota bacterium]
MMMNEEEPIHLPNNSNLVSVIIVSYNTKLQLTHCLECLKESLHEVIVVDNHSTDGSPEMVL